LENVLRKSSSVVNGDLISKCSFIWTVGRAWLFSFVVFVGFPRKDLKCVSKFDFLFSAEPPLSWINGFSLRPDI